MNEENSTRPRGNLLHPPRWVRVTRRFHYEDDTLFVPGQRLRFKRRVAFERFMLTYGDRVEECSAPGRDTSRDTRLAAERQNGSGETPTPPAPDSPRKRATRRKRKSTRPPRDKIVRESEKETK